MNQNRMDLNYFYMKYDFVALQHPLCSAVSRLSWQVLYSVINSPHAQQCSNLFPHFDTSERRKGWEKQNEFIDPLCHSFYAISNRSIVNAFQMQFTTFSDPFQVHFKVEFLNFLVLIQSVALLNMTLKIAANQFRYFSHCKNWQIGHFLCLFLKKENLREFSGQMKRRFSLIIICVQRSKELAKFFGNFLFNVEEIRREKLIENFFTFSKLFCDLAIYRIFQIFSFVFYL